MIELSRMTGEELDQKYGEGASQNMQLYLSISPQYKQIQESMKDLLDQFYKENNLSNDQLIE